MAQELWVLLLPGNMVTNKVDRWNITVKYVQQILKEKEEASRRRLDWYR